MSDSDRWLAAYMASHEARKVGWKNYSWAVPNDEAIQAIADLPQPIVELGAGTGYWASLVAADGADITAFDKYPPHKKIGEYRFEPHVHFPVRRGTPATIAAGKVEWKTLLLVWPCYKSPFAFDALSAFSGDTLAFVGESRNGCTGDNDFFDLLESSWKEICRVSIPQWNGIHDSLTIFTRISTTQPYT